MKYFRFTIILIGCSLCLAVAGSPFNYTRQWQRIATLESKNLPQSALQAVDSLINIANQEKNSPQFLKGWLYRFRFLIEKDRDSFIPEIDAMEKYTAADKDPVEKGVLHSLLAKLYEQYYQQNRYTINQRTKLMAEIPADMKEWSANVFADTVSYHVRKSLEDAAKTQAVDALRYSAIIEPGASSRILQPTLYDFLCARAVEILTTFCSNEESNDRALKNEALFDKAEQFINQNDTAQYRKAQVLQIYRQWLSFRIKSNNKDAQLNIDLDRIQFVYDNSELKERDELYLAALEHLKKEYEKRESVIDVIAKLADYYREHDEYDSQRPAETYHFRDYQKRAFDFCEEGIRRFPNSKRINKLKTIELQIKERKIDASNPEIIANTSPLAITLTTSNTPQLEIRIYRIEKASPISGRRYLRSSNNNLSKGAVLIASRKIDLKTSPFFRQTDTTIILNSFPYGNYEYTVSEPNIQQTDKKVVGQFTVSNLAYFARTIKKDVIDLYVIDRTSGHPQKNGTVCLYKTDNAGSNQNFSKLDSCTTEINGHCSLDAKQNTNLFIRLHNGKDSYFPFNYINRGFYSQDYPKSNPVPQTSLFTDRAIYRPGQTVYFKGIAWQARQDSSEVIPGKKYTISLRDANYQEVERKSFISNEFGSFNGSFALPKDRLNGYFTIRSEDFGEVSFRVEEYKRPSFEVTFDSIKGTPSFGDKLRLSGNVRSYVDFAITGASVTYRIVRRPHWLMRWHGITEDEITNGTLKTDEKGNFSIVFVPEKQKKLPFGYQETYTYILSATVTDANGETQGNKTTFSVGDVSMNLTANTKEAIDKDQPFDIEVNAQNLNDTPVKTTIHYTLSLLKPEALYSEKIKKENLTTIEQIVLNDTINTSNANKITISHPETCKSGKYLLTLTAKDEQGRPVKTEKTVILYSPQDKQLPVKSYCWSQEITTVCEPGENAEILFGTSAPDTKILYELMDGNKILESKWMDFDNELKRLSIPFKQEWNQGITLRLTFIKDAQYFTKEIKISHKDKLKNLTPKFSVFRSKLQPGQKEEWRVTIPELKGNKNQAEIMATMYDASLDVFAPLNWRFNPVYLVYPRYSPTWNVQIGGTSNNNTYYLNGKITESPSFFFDNFDNILNSLFEEYPVDIRIQATHRHQTIGQVKFVAPKITSYKAMVTRDFGKQVVMVETGGPRPIEETESLNETAVAGSGGSKRNNKPNTQATQPRQNFAETAFFHPQLRTDENGEVSFSFTVPESLTRWNLMGLAHTKDLYFGQWSAQAVTQKQFMVQPNMPRFVRESDTLTITAKLINLSDKKQEGIAHLELTDPETNQTLPVEEANRTFIAEQDGTTTLAWKLCGFAGKQMLICKVTASTDEFSDGEEHYLPVLPDKLRVTETFPFRVRTKQTKEFTFERLKTESAKVDSKSLTLEMTSNPTWYALQALPALSLPDNDCSVCWFSAYYANTLAAAIAKSDPKIAETFKQWQLSGNALQSNLEKNEELKNLVLTETPWVLEAKNESEQKQRIAELFDSNRQADKRRQSMEKLSSLQLNNGAFTWFKGMGEDRFLTQYILEGMARLTRMGAESYSDKEKVMIKKALRYADEHMALDFEELKKYVKDWKKSNSLTPDQIYYFYMRSSYRDIAIDKDAAEAVAFYQKLLASDWTNCTLFGKALIAVTSQRYGDKKLATDIVKSLVENATTTDEKGMFWQNNRSGLWWHESDIATQTAIIEALSEINNNAQQTDDMRFWLLSQKQTERWHSPIATADAVYALLMNGSDWLSSKNDVQVKLGKQVVTSNTKETGTGYFKTTFAGDAIKPEMATVTVRNNESHPAWGALYWQYETTFDKVTSQKSAQLNVDKKLYIVQTTPTGPVLTPISNGSTLRVGDKVTIRLVVTTDRDMEYVALTDLRAACLEPTEQLSGCRWKERVCYYQSTKDASTQFFFSFLPKGAYVFEYSAWVTRGGTYSNGIETIQCQYAPEFSAHSASQTITIK